MSIADARQYPWIPILLYHRVVPVLPDQDPFGNCVTTDVFAKQLQWLSDHGYHCASLHDLERCLPSQGRKPERLPSRSFLITFDDGYQDNYLYAWPLLQHFGFTATIFLVTGMIGRDNRFDPAHSYSLTEMLSSAEIQEMYRHGIHFESHTCSHPNSLAELPDDALQDELERSRTDIANLVGTPSRYFAYPHSKTDPRVERAVEEAGYALACGGVGTRFSRFCLSRIEPGVRQGLALEAHLKERYLKWLLKNRARR
jgi:peptidoglycan/xylan/chitin deacetylase (PgdA/CDA1 family)